MNIQVMNFERNQKEVLSNVAKTSFYIDEQKNGTNEIGFKVYLTGYNQTAYNLVTFESSVFWDGQEYIIKELSEQARGSRIEKIITAVHVSFTMQDGYQYDTISGTFTISQCLNHTFAPDSRGFTFRVLDPDGLIEQQSIEDFGDRNYLRLVNWIISRFDVVMIMNNKHLTFVPTSQFGQKTNNMIRYKYNTDEVAFEINTYGLRTQIKGFGGRHENADGPPGDYLFEPITYTSPEHQKWGIRIAEPIRDERFSNPNNMREHLKRQLQDHPEIIGIVHLKLPFNSRVGDYIRFVYEPLNVNQFIQIVGLKEWPFMESRPPQVTLSNTRKTMTSFMTDLAERR